MNERVNGLAKRVYGDVGVNLGFFTRLPLPLSAYGAPNWRDVAWAAPLAGALVGAIGAAVLVVGQWLALPSLMSATFAVGALALTTGALHEDGLADVADGFGGGATRERKLEIMRDSRIGAFGAVALVLSLLLRVEAVAAMLRPGGNLGFAAAGLILASAAARAGALAPLALLPPARLDGAGATAGGLRNSDMMGAALSVVIIAFLTGLWSLEVVRALFACALTAAAAWGACAMARRQIGGQTGDVAGASAQICEIVALCALLIGGRAA